MSLKTQTFKVSITATGLIYELANSWRIPSLTAASEFHVLTPVSLWDHLQERKIWLLRNEQIIFWFQRLEKKTMYNFSPFWVLIVAFYACPFVIGGGCDRTWNKNLNSSSPMHSMITHHQSAKVKKKSNYQQSQLLEWPIVYHSRLSN